jgi:iron(III) transport system substrate-binding protein
MSRLSTSARRRGPGSLALLIAVGMLLATFGASSATAGEPESKSWKSIVAAAEREGTVTIYSSQVTAQLERLQASFERKYPKIKLEVVRSDDPSLTPRVEAEQRTGEGIADLFVSASVPWIKQNVSAFVSPRGPDLDSDIYDRSANVHKNKYFEISAFVGAFAWNTQLFSGKINDWPDFLDRKLDGKIGIVNPDTPTKVAFYEFLQRNYGKDYLKKLARQNPRVYPSLQPMVGALTSGEIAAATFVQPLTDEQAAGAPVEWGLGKQPWGTPFYGMVLESAPHKNAAQVLANFLVTREGQEAIAVNGGSVIPDVPGAVTTTNDMFAIRVAKVTPDKLREFQTSWQSLFG